MDSLFLWLFLLCGRIVQRYFTILLVVLSVSDSSQSAKLSLLSKHSVSQLCSLDHNLQITLHSSSLKQPYSKSLLILSALTFYHPNSHHRSNVESLRFYYTFEVSNFSHFPLFLRSI